MYLFLDIRINLFISLRYIFAHGIQYSLLSYVPEECVHRYPNQLDYLHPLAHSRCHSRSYLSHLLPVFFFTPQVWDMRLHYSATPQARKDCFRTCFRIHFGFKAIVNKTGGFPPFNFLSLLFNFFDLCFRGFFLRFFIGYDGCFAHQEHTDTHIGILRDGMGNRFDSESFGLLAHGNKEFLCHTVEI